MLGEHEFGAPAVIRTPFRWIQASSITSMLRGQSRVPPSAQLMRPHVRSSSKDENKVVPTRGFAPLASSIPTRRTSACASTAWPRELELNQRMQPSEGHCRCPPAAREWHPRVESNHCKPTFVASEPMFPRRAYWLSGLDLHQHPSSYEDGAPLLVLPDSRWRRA
jgi:hypothetical protein